MKLLVLNFKRNEYQIQIEGLLKKLYLNSYAGPLIIDETDSSEFHPNYEFKDGMPKLFSKQDPTVCGEYNTDDGIMWKNPSHVFNSKEMRVSEVFDSENEKHIQRYNEGIVIVKGLLDHIRDQRPDRTDDINALELICKKNPIKYAEKV